MSYVVMLSSRGIAILHDNKVYGTKAEAIEACRQLYTHLKKEKAKDELDGFLVGI